MRGRIRTVLLSLGLAAQWASCNVSDCELNPDVQCSPLRLLQATQRISRAQESEIKLKLSTTKQVRNLQAIIADSCPATISSERGLLVKEQPNALGEATFQVRIQDVSPLPAGPHLLCVKTEDNGAFYTSVPVRLFDPPQLSTLASFDYPAMAPDEARSVAVVRLAPADAPSLLVGERAAPGTEETRLSRFGLSAPSLSRDSNFTTMDLRLYPSTGFVSVTRRMALFQADRKLSVVELVDAKRKKVAPLDFSGTLLASDPGSDLFVVLEGTTAHIYEADFAADTGFKPRGSCPLPGGAGAKRLAAAIKASVRQSALVGSREFRVAVLSFDGVSHYTTLCEGTPAEGSTESMVRVLKTDCLGPSGLGPKTVRAGVAFGDLDGDQLSDLVIAGEETATSLVWFPALPKDAPVTPAEEAPSSERALAACPFGTVQQLAFPVTVQGLQGLTVGNLDGDDRPEVVVAGTKKLAVLKLGS